MTEIDPATSAHPVRTTLIWIVKVLVSAGLLYFLLRQVDMQRLWQTARAASLPWLGLALLLYFAMTLLSAWRWGLLLAAQGVHLPFKTLEASFLLATFFNNFLPSNIGGDVIRIRDTARPAGSKTLATTVVLLDRGLGLLGLIFVAAVGATLAARQSETLGPFGPGVLWAGFAAGLAATAPPLLMPQSIGKLLRPLRALHAEWVDARLERLTSVLARFRAAPRALAFCFAGAVLVQGTIVLFYAAIARGLHIPIPLMHLAILIPLSFIVQMLPVSVGGFGVRESTFTFYFAKIGLPIESALALSFAGAILILLFSLTGGLVAIQRSRTATRPAPR
jgi:uncharacterized membrane protein YbhN (UPF0104 family)